MTATTVDLSPGRAVAARAHGVAFGAALVGLALVALAVRAAVVLGTPHFATVADSATYDRMAVSIARHGTLPPSQIPLHGGPAAYPPPLFAVVLAGAYKLVGTGDPHARWEAGRMLEALLGALAVVLIAALAARLFGRRTALLAAAIAALYPPLVLVGSSLMSESLFIPFVLAAVLSALVGRDSERPLRSAAATGILVALCALTRSNGIVLVVPIAILAWGGRPRFSWRAARAPLVVLAATVASLTPWIVRNTVEFHEFVPIGTETGYALAGTYSSAALGDREHPALWTPPVAQIDALLAADPNLNEAQIADRLQSRALSFIAAHPAYPLTVAFWSAVRLLNLSGPGFERWSARWEGYPPGLAALSVYAFWVLGALALAGIAARPARAVPWALWACPLVIVCSAVPLAGLTRYRAPADPFLVMLAALALSALLGSLAARVRPGVLGAAGSRSRAG